MKPIRRKTKRSTDFDGIFKIHLGKLQNLNLKSLKLCLTRSIPNVQTQDFYARVKINSHKLIIFCGNVKWEGKKRPNEKHLFLEASNNYANRKSFPKRVCSKNLRKNTKLFELIFPDSGVFPTSRLNTIYLKHSLYICPHQIEKVRAFLISLWFSI